MIKFEYPLILILLVITSGILVYFEWRTTKRASRSTGVNLLRLGVLLSLSLAAALPYVEDHQSDQHLLVLTDISDSIDDQEGSQLLAKARRLVENPSALTILPFAKTTAATAINAEEVRSFRSLRNAWGKLDVGASNLEQALEQAQSIAGATIGAVPNVVLLSDGRETEGSLSRLLEIYRSGAPLRVFPITLNETESGNKGFRISQLSAPLVAPAQKSVDINVSLLNGTGAPQSGMLEVRHDDHVVLTQHITIDAGDAFPRELLLSTQSDPSKEGIKEITATLTPDDRNVKSSSATIFLSGENRERVLMLSGAEDDERILSNLLKNQSYQLTNLVAGSRATLPELSDYSTIIFNNIAASQLPAGTASKIEQYVKGGGGFLMIGGNRSFGLGGYIGTSIEDVLPVRLVPPQTIEKRLNLAVELVIDKSASMGYDNKLEFAKEAAREVVRNLKDDDLIGVIGFDTSPWIVVKLERLEVNRAQAQERIGRLFPAQKTNLMPAIQEARRSLQAADAGRKHLIILTDGKLPDAGPSYLQVVRDLRLSGLTVSTIMLGAEADIELLKDMADLGGGAFYQTTNAQMLPRIFMNDIKTTSGERSIKEQTDYLVRHGTAPLRSTTVDTFPPLRGYVETRPRSDAALELVVASNDKAEPLLASWRYGKGKSIAFTSDLNGRWSNYWMRWPKLVQFTTDLIDSVRPNRGENGANVRFDFRQYLEGGTLVLDTTVYSEEAARALQGELLLPSGTKQSVRFNAISPGHLLSRVEHPLAGRYELRMQSAAGKLTPLAFEVSGESFGEHRGLGFDLPQLSALASASGGILNPTRQDLSVHANEHLVKRDISFWAIILSAIFFLIEILARQRALPRFLTMRSGRRARSRP